MPLICKNMGYSDNNDASLLLTVITVVFNGDSVLERTIKSVLNQTYNNIEYIIVDGGSTDKTLDIIAKYKHNISIWISEPDDGISDAMNKGIKLSSGCLIHHLHAGDEFASNDTVETVVDSYLREKWRWCFGKQLLTNTDGKICYEFSPPRYQRFILDIVNIIPHATVFSEHSLFEESGLFDMGYQCAMDYHLWLRFSRLAVPKQFDNHTAKFLVGGKSSDINLALDEESRARREILGNSAIRFLLDKLLINIRLLKNRLNIRSFAKKISQ